MIQYYSPNFSILSLFRSLIDFNSEKKVILFFRKYTKKKYILITNSCRTALYLAYQALPKRGVVITNPLTCNLAFEPILAAGHSLLFTDIKRDSLTMQTKDLSNHINEKTVAVQAIHQGGFMCDMAAIKSVIGDKKIYIIEDSAQGLFSSFKGQCPGLHSDIVCFSLIKNAFGIGGGIFATDDYDIYKTASEINSGFKKTSTIKILYRIFRNILETHRNVKLFDVIYNKLMKNRKSIFNYTNKFTHKLNTSLPSSFEIRIASVQLNKARKLNDIRKKKGEIFLRKLKEAGLVQNYKNIKQFSSSFPKLFIVNNKFNSENDILSLNKAGIEAKHLEHRFNYFYQPRIDEIKNSDYSSNINDCYIYKEIYKKLISLPLTENLSIKSMDRIIKTLKNLI